MIDVYVEGLSIDIGRQGENLARNIYFDLSELINTYGEGTATLVHMRPSDKAPYVCAVTRSDTFLIWAPTSTDTSYAGTGKCELRWVVGDVLAKSIVYRTFVAESITGDSTVPSEYESWYEALLEHISEYEIASDQIETNTRNIATNTNDIAVLDGRVDELTTLPEGSTTGDAELADIRVGADGTVYDNAGDAVRTQIADLKYGVKKTNDELFADGNIPKVGPTFNNYGIGTDGIRYYDSNKQIVRYDISNAKFLHITLKTADDTCVFQSNTSLPDTSTPSVYIVGTPFKGICDRVVEIPDSAVCVFITQAKTLPDDVVYMFSNIDALFDVTSYAPYYFANFEFGSLNISDSGWSASAYNQDKRIRINPNNPLKLLKGDIIKFTQNNIHFAVGYRVDSVYSGAPSWVTGEYVCPVDGEYVLFASYINETTLESVNELAQYCRICRVNSPTYQDIKALQDNASYDLPSYYTETWIDNMIGSIRNKSKILNGICFAFVTDLHFSSNSLNSKYLLKAVLDNTPVPFVVAGGDFAPAKGTEGVLHVTYDNLMNYVESIGQNNWFAMVGNHDFYVTDESVSPAITHYATWGEAYNYIFRKSERNMLNANVNYGCYVIKNDAQKTKIIILNSCEVEPIASDTLTHGAGRVTTAQINWFCEELLKDSGYKIIVMSHIPSDSTMAGYSSSQDEIQNVLVAFNGKTTYNSVNFADTTNELICHITGHSHSDQSHIDRGVLSITTTCDAHYTDDGHGAVVGTVTEQAFDVFCFDYDAETITAVRVGRGATRKWSFDGSVIN